MCQNAGAGVNEAAKAAAGGSALAVQKAVLLVLHVHPSKAVLEMLFPIPLIIMG